MAARERTGTYTWALARGRCVETDYFRRRPDKLATVYAKRWLKTMPETPIPDRMTDRPDVRLAGRGRGPRLGVNTEPYMYLNTVEYE
eukprot:7387405-Prymnesium_polylepis.1